MVTTFMTTHCCTRKQNQHASDIYSSLYFELVVYIYKWILDRLTYD